jgi:hypothetical protein
MRFNLGECILSHYSFALPTLIASRSTILYAFASIESSLGVGVTAAIALHDAIKAVRIFIISMS